MAKYLIKVDETYRADSETEAAALINEAKEDNSFVLTKYTSVQRQIKQKGEVVEEYYRVTLTKMFADEKEPNVQVNIDYNVNEAFDVR